MKLFTFLLSTLPILACQPTIRDNQFSKEDVEKLHLNEVQTLTPIVDSAQTINLNPYLTASDIEFNDIVSETHVIKLETTDESLVGGIYKVIVTESNIYIYDNYQNGGIIIFSGEGKFIKRLKQGEGPGELNHIFDMDYDYENNEICVYQNSSFFFYDRNGTFLRDLELPFGFYNFKITDNGYIFKCIHNEGNYHLGDYHKYSLITTDKNLKIKNVALPIATNVNFIDYSYISDIRPDFLITAPFCDTIYDLQNENVLHAKYILKYDNKVDPSIFKKTPSAIMKKMKDSKSFYHLGKHIETSKYAVFFINGFDGDRAIYMNKETGKTVGGLFHNIDPKYIPLISFPISTYNNYFISATEPYDYKQFEMEASDKLSAADIEKLNDYNSDDNPILVMYKIDNL